MASSASAVTPPTAGQLFQRLDADTVLHLTSFLPTSCVLDLTAASHEWGQIFSPAVICLAISKLSLRGAPLSPALEAICRRFPALTDLSLAHSVASDADIAMLAHTCHPLMKLSLESCDAIGDGSIALLASAMPSLQGLQLLGCRDIGDLGVHALVASCNSLR